MTPNIKYWDWLNNINRIFIEGRYDISEVDQTGILGKRSFRSLSFFFLQFSNIVIFFAITLDCI